jgi:hypothetical protein
MSAVQTFKCDGCGKALGDARGAMPYSGIFGGILPPFLSQLNNWHACSAACTCTVLRSAADKIEAVAKAKSATTLSPPPPKS